MTDDPRSSGPGAVRAALTGRAALHPHRPRLPSPRRLRVMWRHGIRGLALLAQATVLAAVVYVGLLSVLLVGAGR